MAKDSVSLMGQGDALQCGALCWRMNRGRVEVLLVTSRDTGRWVIPKGWPIDGLTPQETAAREAWEEAGVEGTITDLSLGAFHYDKVLRLAQFVPCQVNVFALRVTGLADKFPEHKQRRRKWFSAKMAARNVAEPELRSLLASLPEKVDALQA